MNIKQIGIIGVVVLLLISGIASAQTVFDDFEDNNLNGWDNTGDLRVVQGDTPNGDYYAEHYDGASPDSPAYSIPDQQYDTISFWIKTDDTNLGRISFSDQDGQFFVAFDSGNIAYLDSSFNRVPVTNAQTDTWYFVEVDVKYDAGGTADMYVYDRQGNLLGQDTGINYDGAMNGVERFNSGVYGIKFDKLSTTTAEEEFIPSYTISGKVTDTDNNPIEGATVETDSGVSVTTDSNGDYSFTVEQGQYNVTASKQNYKSQTKNVDLTSDTTVNFALERYSQALQIEGSNFVRPNETIGYTVTYTNETGTHDITQYSTVTSANSTLLSVNQANQTLEAGSKNTTVNITAQYSSGSLSTNTTRKYYVSYLKLENIDTVPPAKWIQAFLGFDDGYAEDKNMQGIGSDIQWLLFMIIIMSVIGKTFDNPWAGIGSGVVTGVLLWVLEYIGLGLLLSTVFFGIFIGLILVRVRRDGGNEVTINES